MKRMSVKAYAKRRGVTPAAVRKAIKQGRIAEAVSKNEKGWNEIDPEVADRLWAANTDPRPRGRRAAKALLEKASNEAPKATGPGTYQDARARREEAEAKLAELKAGQLEGDLVRGREAYQRSFEFFRRLRDRILLIPDRVYAGFAAESDGQTIKLNLEAELIEALGQFDLQEGGDNAQPA